MTSFLVVALIGAVGLPLVVRGMSARHRTLVTASFFVHLLAAGAQYLIVTRYYGGGDMMMYHMHGGRIATLLEYDFWQFSPEVMKLVFAVPSADLRAFTSTSFLGASTGSMFGIGAFLHYFCGGSLLGSCGLIAVLSFYSKFWLFDSVQKYCPERSRTVVLIAFLLVPSVVFWSSGLMKEAVAVVGLGPAIGGLLMVRRRAALGIVWCAIGVSLVWVSKPYIASVGFLALASVAALRFTAQGEQVRVRHALGAGVASIGLLLAFGQLVPQYSLDAIGDDLERLQSIGARLDAGSNYALGSAAGKGLVAQLALAPVALLTCLFRPVIFEVRNPMMLMSALENLVLLYLGFLAIRSRSVVRRVLDSPLLLSCAVFVVVFGIAVGLASTNLGTLSRYRSPLVPFFVLLVGTLSIGAEPVSSKSSRQIGVVAS